MSEFGSVDQPGAPRLQEVSISDKASGRFDFKFIMDCNDTKYQIVIWFNSVPKLVNGTWIFENDIKKLPIKSSRKPKQQSASSATRLIDMSQSPVQQPQVNPQPQAQTGLGTGVTIADIITAQQQGQI